MKAFFSPKSFLLLFIVFSLISCKKDAEEKNYDFVGYAQKGPFVTGSNVTIIELDENLSPTGKTYFSTIDDNAGHFTFPNVSLASQYVQLKVEGNYFDEIGNHSLGEPITLFSIIDVTDHSTININILTHIEHLRIFTLVSNGESYSDARAQAQYELLTVFNLENYSTDNAELLDITSSDIDDGILLAISAIVQANFGSGMQFQEFITNLTTDFKDDGIIISPALQKALCTGGAVINVGDINYNLWTKYTNMGLSYSPYNIQPLLNQFVNNTTYINLKDSIFPSIVNNQINILAEPDTFILNPANEYCIAINTGYAEIYAIDLFIFSNDMSSFSEAYPYWQFQDDWKHLTYNPNTFQDDIYIPISFNHASNFRIKVSIAASNNPVFINLHEQYISWN